jgi:nucleoside phosphorylase
VADGGHAGGSVALLAAFDPELAPLFRLSPLSHPSLASSAPSFGGEPVTRAGRVSAVGVVARAVGIGLPAAAVGTARALAELRPRAVVLVGTCGAYPSAGLRIGDVVVSRRIHLTDAALLAGHSAFPAPMATPLEAHARLAQGLARAGARPADVANTLGITVDDSVAERISSGTGAHVEHLEAYAVALACAAHGAPFAAVLAVANAVGAHARAEWAAHHEAASRAGVAVVVEWLSGLRADEVW